MPTGEVMPQSLPQKKQLKHRATKQQSKNKEEFRLKTKNYSPFRSCLLLMQLFDFSVAQLLCGSLTAVFTVAIPAQRVTV
jgi:hypothetical protein